MFSFRTDLAVEAREIWHEAQSVKTDEGFDIQQRNREGFKVTTVRVTNDDGAKALGKPRGSYVTLELDKFIRRDSDSFSKGAFALAFELSDLLDLKGGEKILVVGLGNSGITADAVGPQTIKHTLVTKHLKEMMPRQFSMFRTVCAIETGVLGTTGIESLDYVKSVSQSVKPDKVIVIDALAARRLARICRTVQLTDTGIVPGSGVGNSRQGINEETLGVPVIAVGVPTVVDAKSLMMDLMGPEAMESVEKDSDIIEKDLIVTPKDIDGYVNDISKLMGYGINLALHTGITIEDITMYLG